MNFDEFKSTVLINIFHSISGFDQFPEGEKAFKTIREKDQDEDKFKNSLAAHSHKGEMSMKLYTYNESRKILEMAKGVYLSHYNLYNYILNNQQKTKDMQILVFVDSPQCIPPLTETKFLGETIPAIKELDDEIVNT